MDISLEKHYAVPWTYFSVARVLLFNIYKTYKRFHIFQGGFEVSKLQHFNRISILEVFFWKDVLKICNKFTGEHPCWSAISKKLQSIFFEITLQHGCSPVNLLHIFRTPFPKNTYERLLVLLLLKAYSEPTNTSEMKLFTESC